MPHQSELETDPPEPLRPGEERAGWLAELWGAHGPGLLLYARQKSHEAEDLVQTAFLKLVRQTELPRDPVTWLYRVVRNESISHWRKEQRRQRHEQTATQDRDEWFLPKLDSQIDAASVTAALQQLESSEQELIVLHLWGNLTFAQLGEVLELSTSTAQRYYAAALARLRTLVTE